MGIVSRLIAACAVACAAAVPNPAFGATVTLRVIALNDFHGHLQSPGRFARTLGAPPGERPRVGGAEYVAGWVAELKRAASFATVVGAGDLIGASPLVSALFHDEPTVEVMNRIGLEFNAVGNHEFDHGWEELLRLQRGGCRAGDANGCRGAAAGTPAPFEGAKFQWLAANVVHKASGQPLLPAYGVKAFGRWKIAFIGMTLKATPAIVMPSGVDGLEFRDEADTVNALAPALRAAGVHAIVVLVHQGGVQTGEVQDINGCDGGLAGSPLASIVGRLGDAVDAVVSGHTHAAYVCRLRNSAGRAIPVTSASAFGRVLTTLDLEIDTATGRVKTARAHNHLVTHDDPAAAPDARVNSIVDAYEALVAPIANRVIGSIAADLPNAAIDSACNMPAGELIADAHLAATAGGPDGAVIAFTNRGGVRSPGFTYASSAAREGDGNVTYGEAFTVQPFGNSLVTMTLTARDLKDLLEEQFPGCRGRSTHATRVLLPSAGFSYAWDGSKPCDARVSSVKLARGGVTEVVVDARGVVLDPGRAYRVTVNSYLAEGGDGFDVFIRGTRRVGGPQDIDALAAYLERFKAPNAPYDPSNPALGKPRIARLNAPPHPPRCPTGAVTNP